MAASWRLTTGLVVMTVLLLQLVAAQEAGTATWKHKRERCLSKPPSVDNGAFPGSSSLSTKHYGREKGVKGCRGMSSGAWCVGRCNPGFIGMPMVQCQKGKWQAVQGSCVPKAGPPPAGPCGSPGDDFCAAIPNAVKGSCSPAPPNSYTCKCEQLYTWNTDTASCLPSLAIAVGSASQALPPGSPPAKPAILLWDGAQWTRQTLPAGLPDALVFNSVALTSKTNAYVAGSVPGEGPGYLLNWDGKEWSVVSNSSSPLEPGADAHVTNTEGSGNVVTLGGSSASVLTSFIGPEAGSGLWESLTISADIDKTAGDVEALKYAKGAPDNSGAWAITQFQVLNYKQDEWKALTDPNPNSYTALAAACCNPYSVWVASSNPLAGTSINKWDFTGGFLVGQDVGAATPPFAEGYAFNDISASDGATAFAVGAGLPDSVGVILGFNDKTQAWSVAFDGRKVTPNLPALRGSFTLNKNSVVAVGDANAVVWWDGLAWKALPATKPLPGGFTYNLRAVALYA